MWKTASRWTPCPFRHSREHITLRLRGSPENYGCFRVEIAIIETSDCSEHEKIGEAAQPNYCLQFCEKLMEPLTVAEVAEFLRAASAERTPVRIAGTASGHEFAESDHPGGGASQPVTQLSLRKLNRVVDYPARDMTITVEAGMTVGELRQILLAENQQLPVDAPADDLTVGALVATDFSGPRRYGYGTLRDYLIGMEAVDGRGRVFHAGGRVVKNVAGYDLCRLMVGSRGTLGVLTQLTFKLKPIPQSEALMIAVFGTHQEADAALGLLNRSNATPVILDFATPSAAAVLLPEETTTGIRELSRGSVVLVLSVSGSDVAVRWQVNTLTEELRGKAQTLNVFGITDKAEKQGAVLVADFCGKVSAAQKGDPVTPWLARLTTLPSRLIASISAMSSQHCEFFGRGGNGVLYIRPAVPIHGERPAMEEPCFQILNGLTADGIGSLSMVRSARRRNLQLSAPVLELTRSIQRQFDPTELFQDS